MRSSHPPGGNDAGAILYRVVPEANMARYYMVGIESSLFGDVAVVRRWGRIGKPCRVRIDLYRTRGEAEVARARIMRAKLAKGYGSPSPKAMLRPAGERIEGQRELPLFGLVR